MQGSAAGGLFSPREILEGLPARRASMLLFAIESRTGYQMVRMRQVAARAATERSAEDRERAFLGALAEGREALVQLTIQDIERYAPEWAELVPGDAAARAATADLRGQKYVFTRTDVPQ